MHFAERSPADGRALRYHFDEFMVGWVPGLARTLGALPEFEVALRHLPSREALALYLEQALYVELLPLARAAFASHARASLRGMRPASVPVPQELAPLIADSLRDLKVTIRPSVGGTVRAGLRRLKRRLKDVTMRGEAGPVLTRPARGMIAVELVEGVSPGGKCDAFWLASGAIDPSRVLFVLEEANRSLVDVASSSAAVRSIGAHLVAVDDFGPGSEGISRWRPRALPEWSRELERELRRPGPGPRRWLARALRRLAQRGGLWEVFYREHGVQAVQQFTELTDETAIKRIAIDRAGGIEFGKMRSQFFERSAAAYHFHHEVALVWHRGVGPILEASHARTRVLVETGYVYDYLRGALAAEARVLRQSLPDPAVTVVAAVFDNYPHVHGHFSLPELEDFYRSVLSLARRHRSLGLVIKSKKPQILAMLPGMARELASLVAAGRCVVLDRPLTSIMATALASDLALGFPASTAGCEAALVGCRALMYDPSRAQGHPWAAPGAGIMFETIEAFEAGCDTAIADIAAGRRGMPQERLLEIDPFLDGNASGRAAGFLNAFIDARDAGFDKTESLARAMDACARYAMPVETGGGPRA